MAGPSEEFTIQEVASALTKMRNKIIPRPTGLTSDMILCFMKSGPAGLFEVLKKMDLHLAKY